MRAPLSVSCDCVLTLEPLRALHTVELSQSRQILGILRALMVCEMLG